MLSFRLGRNLSDGFSEGFPTPESRKLSGRNYRNDNSIIVLTKALISLADE
jgi:hypothetical protein